MTSDETPKETPEQKIARLYQALGLDKITQRQEEQAKMLDGVIHELGNTNQNVANQIGGLKQWLESLIQPQQGQTPQVQVVQPEQSTIPQGIGSILMSDPQTKMQMIQSIGEIIRLIKGQPEVSTGSGSINMQNMLMEWFARVMQASLDGMASQVYGVQFKPPKNIVNSTVRLGNVPQHGPE